MNGDGDVCLLGVDLGAGSLKATVLAASGQVLGEASAPIITHTQQPGWSEQHPADWFGALGQAVPAALAQAGIRAEQLAGLCLSAGAHIPVLLDADNRVLRPAILWNDQRSHLEARELHEQAGAEIIQTSLNRVNPTWTLAMLRWLHRHEPDVVARTHKLMLAKDYLRFCLTGDWHSDFSDAVGALMADAATRNWSPALCRLIDWNPATLPPLARPTEIVGTVTTAAAAATGLPAGLPVVCGSNDTTVELYGAGAITPGQGALKLATAGVLFLTTDGPVVNPPISCYPHLIDGLYYTATGTNSCASAHRWLRERLFPGETFAEMDTLAASVAAGADGLIFHPYLQGERAPYWDPYLRADFIGLTMQHERAHFARALYEGIAYSMRDLLETARTLGQDFTSLRLLGGGARSATWRQIVCDVLGLPVAKPAYGDASFGAALVAGVGVGVFTSAQEAVAQCVRITDHHEPDPARRAFYKEMFAVYKDAQAVLAPLSHRLQRLGR